jgi:hypothetical protein
MHQPEPDEALDAPDDRAGAASHLDLLAEPLTGDARTRAATGRADVPRTDEPAPARPGPDVPGAEPGPPDAGDGEPGPPDLGLDLPGPDTPEPDAPRVDAFRTDAPGSGTADRRADPSPSDPTGPDVSHADASSADTTVLAPARPDLPPTAVLPTAPGSVPVPPGTAHPGPGTPAPPPHHAAHVAGPTPHVATEPVQARHRRQPWAVIVLAFLLAVTLGSATYLLVLTRAHEERAQEWEELSRTTGTELAQVRSDLTGALAELDAVRAQLQTAQTRITELADEKAQLGDDREVQRQLVDYQARVSEAAGTVASALETCVDGQYQLIGYLQNPAAYDAADLERFRTDVQQVCGAARDANAALQRELDR